MRSEERNRKKKNTASEMRYDIFGICKKDFKRTEALYTLFFVINCSRRPAERQSGTVIGRDGRC